MLQDVDISRLLSKLSLSIVITWLL